MRPPVLPSASMTLLVAVAGVAIYWITAAVAELRLQHSYSKFAADNRSRDHIPRPEDSAGHDATDPVTVGATTASLVDNVTSVVSNGPAPAGLSVRPASASPAFGEWYVHGTRPPSPSPWGSRWIMHPLASEPRGMKVIPGSVRRRWTRCGDPDQCDRR